MTGGKKAQRVKGNAKPSSSSRAAEFLQQEGQTGFIGFSNLSGNSFGYVPQPKSDDSELDADLRLLLRKMTKKDTITRLKAIQEFTSLCKEKDQTIIQSVLSFWPRIYSKLAHDFDHRVREAAQQAHHQMTTKAGRNLAPHLKQIIANWLMSFFDTYQPAASTARSAFTEVFQEKKKREALKHCKVEIFEALKNQILKETADTLSDPKVMPVEEREAKYARYVSSSFLVFNFYLETVGIDATDESIMAVVKLFLTEKKFWKFSKHSSTLIRSAFYQLASGLCVHVSDELLEHQKNFCPSILLNIDEQDPLVVKSLWNAVLLCVATIKTCWQFVSSRKAVLPKLWKILRNLCNGNPSVIYPNLLPFLSELPKEVLGDGVWFYEEFFGNMMAGLQSKIETISVTETTLLITSYVECLQYALVKGDENEVVTDYLIKKQLATTLNDVFHPLSERHMWFGIFFKRLSVMLSQIKSAETEEKVKPISGHLWSAIDSAVFQQGSRENKINFVKPNADFFNSLVDFIFSVHQKQVFYIGKLHEEFVKKALTGYIHEILENQNYSVVTECVSIIKLVLSEQVVKCVLEESRNTKGLEQIKNYVTTEEVSSDAILSETFVTAILNPLLLHQEITNESKLAVIQLVIQLTELVPNGKKDEYLRNVFSNTGFDELIFLQIMLELMNYVSDKEIFEFMKSSYMQEKIIALCTESFTKKTSHINPLKWNILKEYTTILKADPMNQSSYHEKLLVLIKDHIVQYAVSEEILLCFLALTQNIQELKNDYFDVLHVAINATVNEEKGNLNHLINQVAKVALNNTEESCQRFCSMFADWLKSASVTVDHSRLWMIVENIHQQCVSDSAKVTLVNHILKDGNGADGRQNQEAKTLLYTRYLLYLNKSSLMLKNFNVQSFYSRFLDSAETTLKLKIGPIKKNLTEILSCIPEDMQIRIMQEVIKRATSSGDTSCISLLFEVLNSVSKCSEELLEQLMEYAFTEEYHNLVPIEIFTLVIAEQQNISTIRALVEKYTDDFEHNDRVKSVEAFVGFIRILSTTINRWFQLIQKEGNNTEVFTEYEEKIAYIFDLILLWKEENAESFLFSSNLNQYKCAVVELNINLMILLQNAFTSNVKCLKGEHWDFILCALISWLETCKESLDHVKSSQRFYEYVFQMFCVVDTIFRYNSEGGVIFEPIPQPQIASQKSLINITSIITDDLKTEWLEFFSPAAFKCLLEIFVSVIDSGMQYGDESFSRSLCQCVGLVNATHVREFVHRESQTDDQKTKLMNNFCEKVGLILNQKESWCFKVASYHLLHRLGEFTETSQCICVGADEEEEESRNFPTYLVGTMEESRDNIIEYLTEECVSIDSPLDSINSSDIKSTLLTYLLSWLLMLRMFKAASPDNRAKFANTFYKKNYVNELVTCLFCLVPGNWNLDGGSCQFTVLSHSELQSAACLVIATVLECIPALVRTWFNNNINRKDANKVDKFVSSTISPLLLKKEFEKLDQSAKEFSNMTIKTRPRAREIIAVYTVDEISMELQLKLANNYPLSPVTVECGKRIGVSTELWRQWMLQLTKFLSFQNGSIIEGLEVWKKNVDKRFEGVEECMVCFSIIHASNYSLPTIACKTCKKKFHSACLYKWFSTSGKSTCPLCRNIF